MPEKSERDVSIIMQNLSKRQIVSIGIINTIIMNYCYFGWKGVLHFWILCGRNVKLYKVRGRIILNECTPFFGCIRIGLPETSLSDNKTIWENNGIVNIKVPCYIGQGNKISNYGKIVFGRNFHMTANSKIICYECIEFGNDVLISWDCLLMDTDFHNIIKNNEITNRPTKIQIGSHCWISCSSIILKGAVLPHDTVVAAGSLITKKYDIGYTILGSNKILKREVSWGG